ncbi:hypothetical protein FSP39_014094 [Pinctada imbricata]|uniref:Kinesin motor domain-containing protein n=1 Tax=Pinctada imbricata TaxID=66713 RepID=A0AA89BWD5_PINIB|nr:hypothetical protein FSP39_014094 [Pinctada imbricata]
MRFHIFNRAAQKLGKKKKRHQQQEPELPQYPTKFNEVLRVSPPPAPPCLLRAAGRLQQPGVGKVKVMLKICATGNHGEQGQSCLSVDPRKKQVTVFDPSAIGITTSAHRRGAPVAPKMFAFDAVFSPDDSQTELCSSSLTEIIQGVVNGADGCLFTYGYSKQGKSTTMLGTDSSAQTLGVMPCAISWLFRLINEQKEKTGARFSVRVSAVEVSGKNEKLKDLLFDIAQTTESGLGTAPGVYLREDPICGTQLENQSELRAPSADRAAYYLDAALAARATDEEEGRSSHLLFTLHVYQYRIEKANQAGLPGVAGGRSRLHLIDLGTSSKSKDPDNVSLSLSALGNVIMALLNGQRHVPHRDSKVAQLLRDSLGNISCRTCMIAHVSSGVLHHNETLQVIQLAARIHRMRRRKTRFSSTSSDDSSTDDGRLRRPFHGFRMGTLREDAVYTSSHSDPDYTSSSEQSCDTVIYVGANGQSLSDREITDNEGPPRSVPRTNPRLPRRPSGSRSSGDEGSNSDSGRSRSSADFRYGRAALVNRDIYHVNRTLSPRIAGVVRDVSVVPKHVQSPPMSPNVSSAARKVSVRTRPSVSKSDDIQQRGNTKGLQEGIKGEQWIDGPGVAMFQESRTKGEQWIDGPQAFVVKAEVASKNDAVNKHLYNPKMNAEEQWVDGPREMIADKANSRESRGHNKTTVHSSSRTDRRGHSQESKGSPGHASRVKIKTIPETRDRPESAVSADSNTSITAQGPDSRPVSQHIDNDKQGEENTENVKPFVRDWVEKHSAITEEKSNSNVGFIVNYDNQVIGSLEPSVKHKRPKPESHRKLSASTPKQSPHHSPRNSPSIPRKNKCEGAVSKLQKSQLPTTANPTKRVTEWLKSVSSEQSHHCDSMKHGDGRKLGTRDLNTSQDISSCSSIHPDTTLDECGTTINTAPCSSDGRPDEMAECNIGDISFDSSVDTTSESNANLLSNNRESIYEMQMDETLERSGDNRSVTDAHDNDTFSSASCSKDNEFSDREDQEDEPLLARESGVPHSLTVESLKTLVAEENQKVHLEQESEVSKSCSCKGCEKSGEIVDKIVPSLGISKSSLLRKPDGASNPNLINELNYDSKMDMNFNRGEYIINNVHAVSSHQEFHTYKSSTSVLDDKSKSDICEKEFSECFMNATKSKPPLPNSRQLKSHSASPSRSNKNKDTSLSPKSNSSYSSRSSSIPVSSHSGRIKEKSRISSTSSISSQRSSSVPVTSSPSSTCTTRSMSSKSSKTQSPVVSRLPMFSSKTLQSGKDSKSRKKEKENKLNGRVGELNRSSSRGTDSDSGNDSGIVTSEKKLLSPYCTVTKPRTPSHSSSGHGSDNSSTVSADLRSQLGIKDKLHGGTSSGYESMLRDSEGDASSTAHEESNSESSSDKKKGSKRKRSSTRRSRSAPARSSESPERKGSSGSGKATSPSPKAWVDTRQIQKIKEEPFEIKLYDVDDVERLQRRRAEDELKEQESKKDKLKSSKQSDGAEPKDQIIMENRNNWTFDCKLLMCFCRSKNKRTDV